MRIYNYLLFFAFLMGSFAAQAQDYKKIKKLLAKDYYQLAWFETEKALKSDADNASLNYYAGVCMLKLYQQEKALDYLLKSNAQIDKKYNYYLGEAYLHNDQPGKAAKLFQNVESKLLTDKELALAERQVKNYLRLRADEQEVVVTNMGSTVNSASHEYSGVMTSDQQSVVFTVRKSESGNIAGDGLAYEEIYRTSLDSDDNWEKPTRFGAMSAKKQHDATVALLDNDTKLISYHDADLFISELKNGKWTKARPLELINSADGAETHCFINQAFDTIYYATDYYSENGDLDLYMTVKVGEDWSDPEPLSDINTPYNDDSPYMAENGDFYFSSQGHNSMGGYDIFKTRFDAKNGKWSKPENLGYNINSSSDDTYFNMYGKLAYLSSGRAGGYGNMDIYKVVLFNKVRVTGKIFDKGSNKAVSGAEIVAVGEDTYTATSDASGTYEMIVPVEEIFDMTISYEGEPIYRHKHFARIKFRDYNDNIVNIETVLTEHILSDSDEAIEIDVIMINDFDTDPLKLQPSPGHDDMLALEIYQKPLEEKAPEVKVEKPVKLPVIEKVAKVVKKPEPVVDLPIVYFDFNQTKIDEFYKTKLNAVITYLSKVSGKSLKLTGHTDLKGNDEYNQQLSKNRVDVVKKYLLAAGLSSARIVTSAKGETSPVVNTEEKSRKNRRVELSFIETSAAINKSSAKVKD